MMNIDQARAGGEGMVSVAKDKKDEDKPTLFETEESNLKISVPDGWNVKKD